MQTVYDTAETTGLFAEGDIKVRIRPFSYYKLGPDKMSFIHIFGYIMEGRTIEQRADLSRKIITRLKEMFPDVPIISMNIYEFERATYSNRNIL